MLESAYQEWLRRLALGDELAVRRVVRGDYTDLLRLEDKTAVLVRLSCIIAAGSDGPALFSAIDRCHAAGSRPKRSSRWSRPSLP